MNTCKYIINLKTKKTATFEKESAQKLGNYWNLFMYHVLNFIKLTAVRTACEEWRTAVLCMNIHGGRIGQIVM